MKVRYIWRYTVMVLGLLGAASASAQEYNVTDLGILPNYNSNINPGGSIGVGIVNANLAVGTSEISINNGSGNTSATHTFTWNGSSKTDIDSPSSTANTIASGINPGGTVVGTHTASSVQRAFTYTTGGGINVLGLPSGLVDGTPPVDASGYAISSAGDVAGNVTDDSGDLVQAAVWENGGSSQILSPEGSLFFSTAYGINSSRTLVGESSTSPTSAATMWIYNSGNDTYTAQTIGSTGTLGGTSGVAYAINDAGVIVGEAVRTSGHGLGAFVWFPGNTSLTDLDPTDSSGNTFAHGINDNNVVVGSIGTHDAFIWDATDGMQDLQTLIDPSSAFTLTNASSIDDNGDIIATATDSADGLPHAIILTPIPEPATAVVALGGLSCLLIRTRKRTRHGN